MDMTNTTPILAIDIDGPLNISAHTKAARKARSANGWIDTPWRSQLVRVPGSPWTPLSELWLHPDHGAMLAEFSACHDVELVWCSLWQKNASSIVSPVLGLPRLPHVSFDDHPRHDLWKWPAVIDYAAGRPLAWVDDSFSQPRKVAQRQASGFDRARRNLPTLCHEVDPYVGITDLDLAVIGEWVTTFRLAWGLGV
jgi:hypothetical protein